MSKLLHQSVNVGSLIFSVKLSSQYIKVNFSAGACVTCQSGVVMTSVQCGHDLTICQVDT